MMSPRRRTVSTLLAMLLVTISFVGADVAYAAAPCYVNNGYINAQDNVSPNLDAPTPNKSWGPYNYTHNLKIAEWCEPGHDWVRDSRIEWSASAVDYIRTHWQRWQDFMIFEQIIASEHQYNNRNSTTASLPCVTYYVADIFEQWSQGYEEAGWWLRSQSQNLVAGQRYYAYAQWDQERSPMTDNWQFLSQAEVVDQWAFSYDGVDPVGKITKKVYNQ